MYKYTNSSEEPLQRLNSPKTRTMSPTIPKPMQTSERPLSGSHRANPGTPPKDKAVCERFTNRTYNRLPSPRGRFELVVNAVSPRQPVADRKPSPVRDQERKPSSRPSESLQSPKPLPRSLPLKQSSSDVMNKRRPLDVECKKGNINTEVDKKTRPKTSHCSRTESRLEHKVLDTVRTVLSRALLQQGKIDETNIGHVIDHMRDSLSLERNLDDEESTEIDIESKPSRTTVNDANLLEEPAAYKKSKPTIGIVQRQHSGAVPERKPYRKIYNQVDSHTMNKNVSEGDENDYVCVDLPDLAFPNFTSSKKTDDKTRLKAKVEIPASKQGIKVEITKEDGKGEKEGSGLLNQHEVGDSQTNDNRFWNPSEDAKLRQYIESLINNMKNQVNCDSSAMETEGEIDSHGTFCRSFCVCKVCVSKKTQSKSVLQPQSVAEEPTLVKCEEQKEPEPTVQKPFLNERTKPPMQREGSRLRLVKTSSKITERNSPCKVIKNTNPNFQPESSLNTSLSKKSSYTVVDTGNHSEDSDDMYLLRRMRKAPSRGPSAKIH